MKTITYENAMCDGYETFAVYTNEEYTTMSVKDKRKISLNLGEGTFGDTFIPDVDGIYNLQNLSGHNPEFWRGLRATRNYLISLCVFEYTVSEAVRNWCDKNKMTIDDLRDIRSTTDFYVVLRPIAMRKAASLWNKPGKRTAEEVNLTRFLNNFVAVVQLAECY